MDGKEISSERAVIAEDYGFLKQYRRKAIIYNNWKLINALELYKIDSDPGERTNLFTKDEKEINIQREKLQAMLSLINEDNTDDSGTAELSTEDRKQLKALGYIQ